MVGTEYIHESADQGLSAFTRGLDDGLERRIRVCPVGALRAVGDLARNHAGTQGAFGAVVGRLGDLGLVKEAQQIATGVMPADLVEQALVVGVVQRPRLEMSIDGLLDAVRFAGGVVNSTGMVAMPQRDGLFEQGFQGLPEGAGRPDFVLEHVVDRADDGQ